MLMMSATAKEAGTLLDAMTNLSTEALYALERTDLEGMLTALSDREAVMAELGPLLRLLGSPDLQNDQVQIAVTDELTTFMLRLENADSRLQTAIQTRRDEVSAEIAQLKAKSGRQRHFLSQSGSSHTLNTRG